MKNNTLSPRPLLLAGVVIMSAAAVQGRAQSLYDPAETSGWFVRLDAAARFNVKASIKPLPIYLGPGVYDNGSVLPDISGTASGVTWNWSYQSASQVRYDVNNQPESIVFERFDNLPAVSGRANLTSPMLEGEMIGGFRFDDFSIGKHKARVALEIGFGYSSASDAIDFQATGNVTHTINSFRLWGVVPPIAPYAGTYHGPGPLIDLNPDPANSSATTYSTTTTFQSTLDTSFYNFRFGPSFGIDLTKRLSAQVGFGYDSVYADASWQYRESSAQTPNSGNVTAEEGKFRVGFYAELLVTWQLSKRWQVLLGGDFRYNDDMVFSDRTHEFTIELGSTYAAKGGVSYSF